MATICMHIGRIEEGRIAHEQALRSNPLTRTGNLEYFHIYSGDFARGEEAAEAWFRERPGNLYAQIYAHPLRAVVREPGGCGAAPRGRAEPGAGQ